MRKKGNVSLRYSWVSKRVPSLSGVHNPGVVVFSPSLALAGMWAAHSAHTPQTTGSVQPRHVLLTSVGAESSPLLVSAGCRSLRVGLRRPLNFVQALSETATSESCTVRAWFLIKEGAALCPSQPELKLLQGFLSSCTLNVSVSLCCLTSSPCDRWAVESAKWTFSVFVLWLSLTYRPPPRWILIKHSLVRCSWFWILWIMACY